MKNIPLKLLLLTIGIAMAASTLAQHAANPPKESGRWVTESGNLEVEIAPCGEALCGTVVKVLANRSMSQPDAEMKSAEARSPLGMKILTELVPAGDGEWKGRLYNRENGETYDCLMSLLAPNELKVRGYKGLPMFGKTQIWRRVAE